MHCLRAACDGIGLLMVVERISTVQGLQILICCSEFFRVCHEHHNDLFVIAICGKNVFPTGS
jgi:hypothetical protein